MRVGVCGLRGSGWKTRTPPYACIADFGKTQPRMVVLRWAVREPPLHNNHVRDAHAT
jgi:hypothetical protein